LRDDFLEARRLRPPLNPPETPPLRDDFLEARRLRPPLNPPLTPPLREPFLDTFLLDLFLPPTKLIIIYIYKT
jgi:hypothetical protein